MGKNIIPNWQKYRILKFSLFISVFIVFQKNLIFLIVSHKWRLFTFLFVELPVSLFISERILFKDKFDSKIVTYNYFFIILIMCLDGIFKYSRNNDIIRQISFWFFIIFIFTVILLPIYRKILDYFLINKST